MGVKPRSVRVASVVRECAWSARRICWMMSHEVRLSPTRCIIARCSRLPWRPSLVMKETAYPAAGGAGLAASDPGGRSGCQPCLTPGAAARDGIITWLQINGPGPSCPAQPCGPLSGSVCMSGREPGAAVPSSAADGQRLGSCTSTWRKVSKSSTHLPVPSTTESSGLSAT